MKSNYGQHFTYKHKLNNNNQYFMPAAAIASSSASISVFAWYLTDHFIPASDAAPRVSSSSTIR